MNPKWFTPEDEKIDGAQGATYILL